MQWQCYCCVASRKSVQYKVDNKTKIKADIVFFFYYFPKTPKRRKGWLQSISRFPRRGRNEKFNVNNALICEFRFFRVKKHSNVMWFTHSKAWKNLLLKINTLGSRKSLFQEIGQPPQEQMNNKTQEASKAFCIYFHKKKLTNF